jgi:hypothetical protein
MFGHVSTVDLLAGPVLNSGRFWLDTLITPSMPWTAVGGTHLVLRRLEGIPNQIADAVPGISPEVQARAFEPFHTARTSAMAWVDSLHRIIVDDLTVRS